MGIPKILATRTAGPIGYINPSPESSIYAGHAQWLFPRYLANDVVYATNLYTSLAAV